MFVIQIPTVFSFRIVLAEMPHYLGKNHEALDRLHSLLSTVDQVGSLQILLSSQVQMLKYLKFVRDQMASESNFGELGSQFDNR